MTRRAASRRRLPPVAMGGLAAVVAWTAACAAGQASPSSRAAAEGALCFPSDSGAPIVASVYSLPSEFVSPAAAGRFLDAVRAHAPERRVLALTDLALAAAPGLHLLAPGAKFSPWPRDPFTLARRADGGVQVVARPNLQRGRETDARLGAALVAELPAEVRRDWGEPIVSTAPVPFHNGQLLVDDDALWLSIHSVEPRALELLGLARVPVEGFAAPGGAARYADAARAAAEELGALVGRPPRFVHPLPAGGDGDLGLMTALGGGAGFDLDSLVTLMRPADGPLAALVADLSLAESLLPPADDPSWRVVAELYGLAAPAGELRARFVAAAELSRARGLDRFLDLVAAHLAGTGLAVERLPLLLLPVAWLGRAELGHPDFVLGWNNVVVERRDGQLAAEGFASGIAALDAEAARRFAAAGARLALLPPLVESVVRNGGYRCASNHLREPDCGSGAVRASGSRR